MLSRTVAWVATALLTCTLSGNAAAASGRVKLLTYNIAGLPDGVMTAQPSANMPLIGELLTDYDVVFVQEDFAYAAELRQRLKLPYGSAPFVRGGRLDFGDGLSQFARQPFVDHRRTTWRSCHGIVDSYFDCLTPKGFTFARQTLAPGVEVDVYNLHMDAGSSSGDAAAREAQIAQLSEAIAQLSPSAAVIVAGDTNIHARQRALLERFQKETGLSDACDALNCAEPRRIDRVFYRSSRSVRLEARRWSIDHRFVDARKRPLSDHLAVAVELEWIKP
ncbi:MAG: endonuclease/exonuclease/phosphatase family protein [Myxococcota bacterium]